MLDKQLSAGKTTFQTLINKKEERKGGVKRCEEGREEGGEGKLRVVLCAITLSIKVSHTNLRIPLA
jgi:hypothetical protein